MRARWWAIATAATLVLLLAATVQAAGPWYVDPTGTDDGSHGATAGTGAFKTIQYAINDSRVVAGDTVNVAAGTYAEQVTITKALTLQGAGATTVIKPSSLTTCVTTPSVAGSTVCTGAVVVNNAGGNVVVKNLKVDASSLPADRTTWFSPTVALMKFAGVFYYNTSGTIDNVVSTNTNHITIATTGASTWGRQVQSFKIDANATTTVSVELKNCTASTFLGEAISVGWNTPIATQTVNIHNNTITGDGSVTNRRQNGIDVYYGYTVTAISHNTISNLVYRPGMNWATGITVADVQPGAMIEYNEISNCDFGITDTYSSGVTIQHNDITGSGHAYGTGIYLDNGAANLTGIIVHANTIGSGFPLGGICLRGWYAGTNTISETITDNILTGNGATDGHGIFDWSNAAGAITSTITGNTITGWDTGIFIDAGAPVTGFTISNNKISGNAFYGVNNGAAGTLIATNNWWGSASGPGPLGTGTGDKVSTRVTYTPWYVDAAMTTLSNVAPTNVYVNATYVDGNAGGHAFGYDAFTTIQSGITAVAASGTVHVAAGTYSEHITIGKSLTLQGSSEPSPIIDGGGTGTALTISASNVTVTGFTIQNAVTGIAATSGTGNSVHFCNIAGNTTWGVNNTSGTALDATDNYWGSDSGPRGAGPGTGDAVSADVLFDPWTGMSTECVVTEPGQGVGDTVENACAQTSIAIVTAGGTTDVTIAKYTDNPADTPAFGAAERYIDVQLSNPAAVTELTIVFGDMAPGTMIYFYRPGTGWLLCSDQTYSGGSIEVKVRVDTVPTLLELTGGIFAEGSAPGDINGDGKKDVLDVRLCLQIATGFLQGTAQQRAAANVDGDSDVDLDDAEWLANYIIHIIDDLGAE